VFPPTHRSVVQTPCFGIQVHWPGKCFAPSPALLCYHDALLYIPLRIYFSFTVASSTCQIFWLRRHPDGVGYLQITCPNLI